MMRDKNNPLDYVRLIRDKKTNVGKGIGYVKFKDDSMIPLALKWNGKQLCGRPVRLSKWKN